MATITYAVTVANPGSGNRYYLNGVLQRTVSAIPGNTYKFDQSDGSNSGHPLRLSTTSNGTHNSGSAYTDGVTTAGTPGSSGAYTQIVVDATTVQTLYYYCTNHSNMGGSFNVGGTGTVQLQERGGLRVQNLSSDSTSIGQIYYNTLAGQFKGVTTGGAPIGTWASGASLNTARAQMGGAGTQASALMFGGDTNPPTSGRESALTESYNGTAWSVKNVLNTARRVTAGAGASNTAAICVGGYTGTAYSGLTETWNGTSWAVKAALNEGRANLAAAGIVSAALAIGGSPPGYTAKTEEWNNTSWTEVADLNTATKDAGSCGVYTAALAFGGNLPPNTAKTESWDGTSWTEVSDLNRANSAIAGSGTQTSALAFGGEPPTTGKTESWDGTSWSEVNDMATARDNLGPSSNAPSILTLAAGGNPKTAATEEFTAAAFLVKTLTSS